MIKGIIFDLDGTLADTMNDLVTAMNSMLSHFGYSERTRQELTSFINNGTREFVHRSLPKDVQEIDFILQSAIDEYKKQYSMCYLNETKRYDGIEAMLMTLKQKGIKMSVLSNKPDKFVKDIIAKLYDKKDFVVIQGNEEKLPLKPSPNVALAIAKKMGVKPSQCLFVGDSDIDIKTAQNAGMRSVGVCWGYRGKTTLTDAGADFIIPHTAPESKEINKDVDANAICVIVDFLKEHDAREKSKKAKNQEINIEEVSQYFGDSYKLKYKKLGTTEINIKALNSTGEHNTKTKKGPKSFLAKKKKKNNN